MGGGKTKSQNSFDNVKRFVTKAELLKSEEKIFTIIEQRNEENDNFETDLGTFEKTDNSKRIMRLIKDKSEKNSAECTVHHKNQNTKDVIDTEIAKKRNRENKRKKINTKTEARILLKIVKRSNVTLSTF